MLWHRLGRSDRATLLLSTLSALLGITIEQARSSRPGQTLFCCDYTLQMTTALIEENNLYQEKASPSR
jgi:hypothetical protein